MSVALVYLPTSFKHTIEIPQYLEEAGWAKNGKQIACTQVTTMKRIPS
jgi:hypothetical protein